MILKFANSLLFLSVFFLPWQTQWILTTSLVSGEPSQFGVFSLYVVEVMIAFRFCFEGVNKQTQWFDVHGKPCISF